MSDLPSPPPPTAERDRFIDLLQRALAEQGFTKLVLAKPRAAAGDLLRVSVREIALHGGPVLSFVYGHRTRDITKNLAFAAALDQVRALAAGVFDHAHLSTATEDVQLLTSKRGKTTLIRRAARHDVPAGAPAAHDREKRRYIDIGRPYLVDLGVTDAQHRLVPALARKWKQINKFVEVFDHAFADSGLAAAERVRVIDFGCGKGYLTFALHDHLSRALGRAVEVTGVELREDLVQLCNAVAQRSSLEGLAFVHGDVRTHVPPAIDVMIALHACDTATDHAIHVGMQAGAAIIMCSPCCHKQIRPQMCIPDSQRPLLQHGIHLGQQAEMVTDSLRALLLEAHGYETRVFEFVSLEHTSKNKMILAVKRAAVQAGAAAALQAQIRAIKDFYGIREQCLETLLDADAAGGAALARAAQARAAQA